MTKIKLTLKWQLIEFKEGIYIFAKEFLWNNTIYCQLFIYFFLIYFLLLSLLGQMIKEHYNFNLILILVRLDSCQASTCTHRLGPYNRFDPNVSNIAPIIDLTMTFFGFWFKNLCMVWYGRLVVPKLFNTCKQR